VKTAIAETKVHQHTPKAVSSDNPTKNALGKKTSIVLAGLTFTVFLLVWTRAIKPDLKDNWNKALELINSSTRSSNESDKTHLLANAHSLLSDLAVKHPYHARVWLIYGYYFIQKKMWDSVIACEKKAIELGKGGIVNQVEFDAADALCYALSMKIDSTQLKNPDQTIALLKKAEVKGFENRCLIKLQGAVYTNFNKTDSALVFLSKAATMQPDADVYFNIALNYLRNGDKNAALQNVRKALEINKDHESAKKLLQEISNESK
jgi:tetratricopeptide (TPR) repeat protein